MCDSTAAASIGEYEVKFSRGPESIPETLVFEVSGPTSLSFQVKRWIDPSLSGWWSGENTRISTMCCTISWIDENENR